MMIVGFGYKKRVGKDTAVKFAVSYAVQNGFSAYRCSLFDPIKWHAHQLYKWGGLEDAPYYDEYPAKREEILPPIGRSPRQIWDVLGTTIRDLCPRTLPELMLSRDYEKMYNKEPDFLFVPDVRGPEEFGYIKRFGGRVYRIDRDAAPKSDHIVDNMLNDRTDWDGIIGNNGDMRTFYQTICGIVDDCVRTFDRSKL